MSKKFTSDLLAESQVYGRAVALLVKLLDINDAELVMHAYTLYCEEVAGDIKALTRAVRQEDHDAIQEYGLWYRDRAMCEAAGIVAGKYGLPKSDLRLIKEYAR